MDEFDMRDLFAALAMAGDLAGRNNETDAEEYTYDVVANRAYSMADAMLNARDKEPQDEDGIAAITKRKK
jgi:hypothetical protein